MKTMKWEISLYKTPSFRAKINGLRLINIDINIAKGKRLKFEEMLEMPKSEWIFWRCLPLPSDKAQEEDCLLKSKYSA